MENLTKYDTLIGQIEPDLLAQWEQEQFELKAKLIETDDFTFSLDSSSPEVLKRVAGLDISVSKTDQSIAFVGLCVLDYATSEVLYQTYDKVSMTQPYVPGFLAFREVDHLLNLLAKLKAECPEFYPELLLIDGNGILHNKGFGIASHLGVLADLPTVGCGKTVFAVDGINKKTVRSLADTNLKEKGDFVELVGDSGKVWGAAWKPTEEVIVPMIVSIGHKISLKSAMIVVNQFTKFRVPEPIRLADKNTRFLLDEFERKGADFDISQFKSFTG